MKNFYPNSILQNAVISLVMIFAIVITTDNHASGQSANLDQVRNGSASSPNNPAVWVNGNAGASNSHYVEGHSIPYRCVMTEMPVGTPVTITFGYDTKHSDGHALDT